MHERASVVLIEALARIWSRIRVHHPDVPGVILLAIPSPRRELNVLGHFAPLRWRGKQQGDARHHEVVVVAEHLDRTPAEILGTLLHEAAHALNFERGIKDCTTSQYHNRRFKAAAEELGLVVETMAHYGHAYTKPLAATLARYEEDVHILSEALIHRAKPLAASGVSPPKGGSDDTEDDKPTYRNRKAVCQCPFIIRVAKSTLDQTVIRCDTCREPFVLA